MDAIDKSRPACDNDFVFTGATEQLLKESAIEIGTFNKDIKELNSSCGLPDLKFDDFRNYREPKKVDEGMPKQDDGSSKQPELKNKEPAKAS